MTHLYTADFISTHKRHICLTYDERIELVQTVREKLDCMRKATVGTCSFCRRTTYLDRTRYELEDGRLVHRICMGRFIQSEDPTAAAFPVKKTGLADIFDHAWLFRKHHNPNPFPLGNQQPMPVPDTTCGFEGGMCYTGKNLSCCRWTTPATPAVRKP